MRISRLWFLLCLFLVSGCAQPVKGRFENRAMTFSGSSEGSMTGHKGSMEIELSTKTVCKGDFVFVNPRVASGMLHCEDGRKGNFQFTLTGQGGNGYGELAGEAFTFIVGF